MLVPAQPADAVAVRKLKLRADAAKELSEVIAKKLLEAMGQNDKFNGYSVAENREFFGAPGAP